MPPVKSAIFDSDDRRALCDLYIPWLVTGIYHGLYDLCPLCIWIFHIEKRQINTIYCRD